MRKILLLLAVCLVFGCLDDGVETPTAAASNAPPASVFQMQCSTVAPLNPGVVVYTQTQGLPATQCFVRNGAEAASYIITAEVPQWTEKASQTVYLEPNAFVTVNLTLAFKDKFYTNREFQNVQIQYSAEKDGKQIYSATQSGNVTSATQMLFGGVFDNQTFYFPFVAVEWVTPDDPCIERVISAAKELMPNRAFSDYQGYAGKTDEEKAQMTMTQAEAVYNTLQAHGMSYVNSVTTFGDPAAFAQNVRLPYESLETKNANCIDGAVLYAAIFEKIGLEPVIIIVPGHAFVGVRNDRNSSQLTFIETTATGTKSFYEAALSAEQTFNAQMEGLRNGDNESMMVPIDVKIARSFGVAPFPNSHGDCDVNITAPAQTYNPYTPLTPSTPQITCSDGTPNFQCSTTQPSMVCMGGILIPDCFDCGCPAGYACYYDFQCYRWQ